MKNKGTWVQGKRERKVQNINQGCQKGKQFDKFSNSIPLKESVTSSIKKY